LKKRSTFDASTRLFAKKEEVKSENEYWQGEWVCADCGYVYDRDIDGGGLYFEQQKKGFICPQCSAPRKRYAKKVGDQWGVTRGSDYVF
jgi:rubredoxin